MNIICKGVSAEEGYLIESIEVKRFTWASQKLIFVFLRLFELGSSFNIVVNHPSIYLLNFDVLRPNKCQHRLGDFMTCPGMDSDKNIVSIIITEISP